MWALIESLVLLWEQRFGNAYITNYVTFLFLAGIGSDILLAGLMQIDDTDLVYHTLLFMFFLLTSGE